MSAMDDSEWDKPLPPAPRPESRFEVYCDNGGKWRWREVAANGRIIADSGQGYASKSNANRAWRRVAQLAGDVA